MAKPKADGALEAVLRNDLGDELRLCVGQRFDPSSWEEGEWFIERVTAAVDWTVLDGKQGDRGINVARCLRCGGERVLKVPLPVSEFVAAIDRFNVEHASCPEKTST